MFYVLPVASAREDGTLVLKQIDRYSGLGALFLVVE